MKTTAKRVAVLAAAVLSVGAIGAASAGEWVPGPYGPVYQPTCQVEVVNQVWIQTGPFPGQGFWRPVFAQVCD